MCQGVIVSLIKWPDRNGRLKRFVHSGIGSHSEIAKRDAEKIKKLCPCDGTESLVTIESDFTAWNKFSLESGRPDETDLRLLKKEYKKCAGSASALIAHVKKHRKIDDSLINILSDKGQKAYYDALAPIQKAYDDARAPIQKAHNDARAPIWIKIFKVRKNRRM